MYLEKEILIINIVLREQKSKPRGLVDQFFGGGGGGGGGGDRTWLSWGVSSAAVCFVGFLGVQ